MTPFEWLLMAQAGVSVVGSVYNMFAGSNNADEQLRRQKNQAQLQTDQVNLGKVDNATNLTNTMQDIGTQQAGNVATQAQAGQVGPSSTLVENKLVGTEVARTEVGFNARNQSLDLQQKGIDTGLSYAAQDAQLQKDTSFIQGAINIGSTVLGTAAGVGKSLGNRASDMFAPPVQNYNGFDQALNGRSGQFAPSFDPFNSSQNQDPFNLNPRRRQQPAFWGAY